VRQAVPTLTEWGVAGATALLLILSFPNFEFSFLAWISLVPLLLIIAQRPSPGRALILGWAAGAAFFYATCYWLTHSMIHYGGLPTVVAYLLLIPGAIVISLFPGLFAFLVALSIKKWGQTALLLAPAFWAALEWARLGVTGQLWNAIGYSQAFHSSLIRPAAWGGVYAVSFVILGINSAIALLIIRRTRWSVAAALSMAAVVVAAILISPANSGSSNASRLKVVALQPNVPMTAVKSLEETKQLLELHFSTSTDALQRIPSDGSPRLVIWPESPMNFTYASDRTFRELVAQFAKENRTSLLFNSLEPAPADGSYNSALLINEEGHLISQYDKIRLMPFGEYVPLPQWLPGASLITTIVGEFTPGDKYTLMPVGDHRAGVFICIESAYPWIPRRLTSEGADVLINISNDGYLGPTAVMRQHLANAVFRAVENGRPLLRVTNTGLSAPIRPDGIVEEQMPPFQADVRVWNVSGSQTSTFYTRHGDLFVHLCAALTAILFIVILLDRRRSFR
jgi:apolipoprotein N-acyltransferase